MGKNYLNRFRDRRRKEERDVITWHIETGRTAVMLAKALKKYGPTIGKYLGGLAVAGIASLIARWGLSLDPQVALAVEAAVAALTVEAINLIYQYRDNLRQKRIQESINNFPASTLEVDGKASDKTLHNLGNIVEKAQLWEEYERTQSTEKAAKLLMARKTEELNAPTYYY